VRMRSKLRAVKSRADMVEPVMVFSDYSKYEVNPS
jgi:hypothetical protein